MTPPSIFTKIINREVPADILFENERIIVIKDIKADAPIHYLGITKHPYLNLDDLLTSSNQEKELLWELFTTLASLADQAGIKESGYRIITNNGPDARQVVPHLHIHLLGGEPLNIQDHPQA